MDKIFSKSALSINECMVCNIPLGGNTSVAIDQSPASEANINHRTGFPYTDLQKVMLQQDLSERRRILENLPSYKEEFLDASVTNEQAIKFMRPSNNQLPSEMAEKLEEDYKAAIKEKEIELEDIRRQKILDALSDSSKVVEPKKE